MRLYCPKSTPQDKFERLDCCFLHAVTLSVIYLVTDAWGNVKTKITTYMEKHSMRSLLIFCSFFITKNVNFQNNLNLAFVPLFDLKKISFASCYNLNK